MSTTQNSLDWPALANELAERVGRESLHPEVLPLLQAAETRRVLVACSGGPDSVFLMCLLWASAKELGLELVVAHYNHRWRGEQSDMDAEFVRGMAEGLQCAFEAAARPEKEAAFTETTARALRLDFLRAAARKHGCQCIAYGHQQNDILETQLQRLVRGVSSDGLAAPRPVHRFEHYPTHVRPVLSVRAGDIRMSLACCGLPWCEDSSNADTTIARNALRHRVVPDLLDALGRDVSAGAARTRQLLAEDAAALDLLAHQQLPEAFSGAEVLAREALRAAPVALQRRALTAWLHAHGLISSVSAPAMDYLVAAINADDPDYRMSAGAAFIVLHAGQILIEEAGEEPEALRSSTLEGGEDAILSTGAVLETEYVDLDGVALESIFQGEVNPRRQAYLALDGPQELEIRPIQPGDRFKPVGAPGNKKLKDWFIDRQIPRVERKQLPLVINSAGEILWVPGFPPADAHKIAPGAKRALRLTYLPRNPL